MPIRNAYTDLVRAATNASATDRFVPTDARNGIVHDHRLEGSIPALSLRRARSTWLVAHLTAGTPLGVLRMISGPLSANTLDGLLPFATNSLDDETAAMGVLGRMTLKQRRRLSRRERTHRSRTRRPQTPTARRFPQRNHTQPPKQSPAVPQKSKQTNRPADRANAGIIPPSSKK